MNRFFSTVLLTGLFVGITDLIAAYTIQFVKTGQFAGKLLHYIAGGALGLETSMKGGFWMGLLGLFFHFFIAFSFTLFYFFLYPGLKLQRFNKYLLGLLYGLFVSRTMALLVLPLTRLPKNNAPFNLADFLINWTVLSIAVGVPIALSAHKFYANQQNTRMVKSESSTMM